MGKDRIFIGLAGILAGFIVGFIFANSINRSASGSEQATVSTNAVPAPNPALPPDHPPLAANSDAAQGVPLPQIMQAIEKAKLQPGDFDAQMTAGDLYYQIQRFDDAIVFFEKADKLRPDQTETVIKLGNAYFDAERYEDAEESYQAALKKTPDNVNLRSDFGLTFFLRTPRDIQRAIKEYNLALAIEPDSEFALQNLAAAYRELDDAENLQKTIEKLKKANPENPLVLKTEPNSNR